MKRLARLLALLFAGSLAVGAVSAQDGGGSAAASAPAAAAATSAPAAASSSVASATPSATQTPASTSATDSSAAAAATSAAETPAALTPNAGESDADFLVRVMQSKSGQAVEDEQGKAAEQKPGEETPKEGEETPGEKDGEETPGEEDGEEYDPYTPLSAIAPKELSDKINGNPALKAALDADPALKETLFNQSRLAAETAAFKEVFTSADEAKVAAAGNTEFLALSDLVTSIEKPEDAQGFYAKLLNLSVLHDDDGNPIMRDGKPVSDGTVGRLIHHTGALFLNHFEQLAQTSDDDELTAAVEVLKARAFGDKAAASGDDLTEEQKAQAAKLTEREQNVKAQELAAQQTKTKQFEDSIVTGIDTSANTSISKLLGRTDIPEADREGVTAKIREAAYALITDNPQFRAEQDALMRRTPGDKTRDARIGLGKKWLNVALPIVAPKVISEAGAKILSRQAKAQAAQTARQDASRSEAEGTLRVGKPTNTNSGKDVMQMAQDNLKAKYGRAPNDSEIFQEVIRLRTAQ